MAARVLYPYASTQSDELILRKNEVIEILEKTEEDWWRCRNTSGDEGMAPLNYLEVLSLPPGWVAATDKESGDEYYFNAATGVTQWEFPLDTSQPSSPHSASSRNQQQQQQKILSEEDYTVIKGKGSTNSNINTKSNTTAGQVGKAPSVGDSTGLPQGWTAFTDQASGDQYFHHAASGETSWEKPKHQHEKKASPKKRTLQQKQITATAAGNDDALGDSAGDLSSLKRMREETAAKMAALRDAVTSDQQVHSADDLRLSKMDFGKDSIDMSSHNNPQTGTGQDRHYKNAPSGSRQADKEMSSPKHVSIKPSASGVSIGHDQQYGNSSDPKTNKGLNNISMEEINKMINERVKQELVKREQDIMAQVEAMMLEKFSKNHNSTPPAAVTDNKKKKKKKQQQAVHESQQLSSRSAESGKTSKNKLHNKSLSHPDLLHQEQDSHDNEGNPFSPIHPLHPFELSQEEATRQKQSNYASSTNDSLFPELQMNGMDNLASPLSHEMKNKQKEKQHRKQSTENVSFPPIVKPEHVPPPREDTIHFEEFESAALNTIIQDEDENSAITHRHKEEAEGTLTLKHVHSYDGRGGTGKNIHWLSRSVIAFPAVAMIILMNVNNAKQQFYKAHTNEVTCLAVHPNKQIIASGQLGKDGRILIWDSSLLFQKKKTEEQESPQPSPTKRREPELQLPEQNILKELMMEKTKGILGVNFSGDGKLLVTIGMHESTPVCVFDWNKGTVLSNVTLGHTDIYQVGFNPFLFNQQVDLNYNNNNIESGSTDKKCCYTLISCGSRSVKFWSLRRECEVVGAAAAKKKGKGGGFKGRQLAIPKNKQKWEWKYSLEGNTGNIPKKQSAGAVEMTCFAAVAEPFIPGTHVLPQSKVLTGASNGCVYIWQQQEVSPENADDDGYMYWLPRGNLLCVVSDVHDGPIFDLDHFSTSPLTVEDQEGSLLHRVATCSKDGTVNLWELDSSNPSGETSPMEHLSVVNISGSDATMGQPRSISYSSDGKTLAVGTTHNCICTLLGTAAAGNPAGQEESSEIVRLHTVLSANYGKGRRLAPHPFMDICATVSSDKTLRLWSVKSAAQVAYTRIGGCGSSLTFTPDGTAVAIGTDTGEVLILTCTYLQFCRDNDAEPGPDQKKPRWDILGRKFVGVKGNGGAKKDVSKTEITDLKYSPGGDVLAVATRDKIIHLLSAANGYKRTAACKGHSSAIVSLAFTDDGVLLQSSDCVRETLFWDVSTGKLMSDVARAHASKWDSWSNLLGPSMQGVCNGSNPSDPRNQVDPSPSNLSSLVVSTGRSNDSRSLVVGGGGQTCQQHCLKLFKNPCTAAAVAKEYTGHSSAIGDVCFLNSDRYVVSMGGNDASVLVWVHR